jgi:hypothetical protein
VRNEKKGREREGKRKEKATSYSMTKAYTNTSEVAYLFVELLLPSSRFIGCIALVPRYAFFFESHTTSNFILCQRYSTIIRLH